MLPNMARTMPTVTTTAPALPSSFLAAAVPRYRSPASIMEAISSWGRTFMMAKLKRA